MLPLRCAIPKNVNIERTRKKGGRSIGRADVANLAIAYIFFFLSINLIEDGS